MDFFGASFTAYILAIAELIAFGWIYGETVLMVDMFTNTNLCRLDNI